MAPASRQKLHVLWATDGSASARNAVPLLRGLVLPAAERLTVLTVAPHSLISGARPDPAFIARVTPAARRGALVEAEQLAMREATALDPPFKPDVLSRWGHPIQEVLRAARSLAADLIVLGAKGHSNLRILVLGSVSQGVVQHATLPVLIARPSAGPVRRVVLGYHGSAAARRAVAFLERLALPPEVEVRLTTVVEPFAVPAGTPIGYRRLAIAEANRVNARRHTAAQRALDGLAARLRADGLRVETEVVAGAAGPELDAAAQRHGAELIVVGSRKPSPARHYLLGSTAEKLVRHARASVLVVR
ncbi:MAG TPA: universal stress protein [Dehalococcoidia bacterium]